MAYSNKKIVSSKITTARLTTRVLLTEEDVPTTATVLFMHGNGSTARFWEDAMLSLPPSYKGRTHTHSHHHTQIHSLISTHPRHYSHSELIFCTLGIAADVRGYGEADIDAKIDATRGMQDLADDAFALLDEV